MQKTLATKWVNLLGYTSELDGNLVRGCSKPNGRGAKGIVIRCYGAFFASLTSLANRLGSRVS